MTWTDFREPWHRAQGDSAQAFEAEAAAEIADGHELHGLDLTAIAKLVLDPDGPAPEQDAIVTRPPTRT